MNNKLTISVAVITYNQEDTIAQTLDSILMQKGDFTLELVIGEDCSTDNTLAICQQFADKYPNTIKLLSGPQNLGITANYFRTLQACIGEFIGDIAGDDYYCDDHALEKQMLYMQQHPEIGVMGSNGYRYYVRRDEKVEGLNPEVTPESEKAKEFYFSPSYKGGVYFKPVGVMFRREMLKYIDFEEIIRRKLPVEDYPIQAIWSQHTHFACLPDLLVTYRIYKESATFVPFDHPKYLEYHRGLMNTRRYLNELFPQDACFSEEKMQEYEFYKEFLLYLHQLKYRKAKELIHSSSLLIGATDKMKQAKRITSSRLFFLVAHIFKERIYCKVNKKI